MPEFWRRDAVCLDFVFGAGSGLVSDLHRRPNAMVLHPNWHSH
ncbi:hypothetical protein GL4_0734 [Methyloceanibacter caenitepidi]|uniref:Uncharacterized protein n=1 Tax=Methyloceanibacter caenitepidi TaxID=1384459 RepID=A0A0A8K121_9HYPH|nr:hypothetical protein GL4_0734 [Methyloceanibacter caenitepidi]